MDNDYSLKESVLEYYEKHKKIKSPIWGDIKITPQSLRHLENKDKNHKRDKNQIDIRYKCFLLIDKIIKKSFLYQEYKEELQDVLIKKKGKKVKVAMKVKYFGLVGIVQAYQGHWIRIKVVIKKVPNWSNCEFISVIPAWNMKGYHRLYFDEEL